MDDRRDRAEDRTRPRRASGLSVELEHDDGTSIVRLAGELDLASADVLGDALGQLGTNGTHHVEICAAGVRFIDSAGLHILLDTRRHVLDRGGSFVLRERSPALDRLLEVCGLAEAFAIHE
jgi:anti-anti-sigma factor